MRDRVYQVLEQGKFDISFLTFLLRGQAVRDIDSIMNYYFPVACLTQLIKSRLCSTLKYKKGWPRPSPPWRRWPKLSVTRSPPAGTWSPTLCCTWPGWCRMLFKGGSHTSLRRKYWRWGIVLERHVMDYHNRKSTVISSVSSILKSIYFQVLVKIYVMSVLLKLVHGLLKVEMGMSFVILFLIECLLSWF